MAKSVAPSRMLQRRPRDHLLDVSRLIWRVWRGGLPTGIDRVCLEYVKYFGRRSYAVVQFRGVIRVLSAEDSDRLFAILASGGGIIRKRLLLLAISGWTRFTDSPPTPGMIYLNVGHTGLHHARLPAWIETNNVKAVYLIHDLIPITHPQFCRPGENARHELRIGNALASAAGVIVNSQATLDALSVFAMSQRTRVPPSVVAWLSGATAPQDLKPRCLPRPHFVALGTVEGRKNHLLLLNVWRKLVRGMGRDAPILIIIGQHGWKADEAASMLKAPELRNYVRHFDRCSDEEAAEWLAGAAALLAPSFTEGFGLPVIEALAAGTPLIATDLPVYREIVGDIPTYLDPTDEAAWEKAVKEFTADGPERKRQKKAMASYDPPTWDHHFAVVERWLASFE